jgi:hypothetical protein
MIELLMMLIIPTEIDPAKLTMKYVLKEKFIDYKTCDEYVEQNTYFKKKPNYKEGDGQVWGHMYYKIDTKEYQVMLTYCKPTEDKNDN